MLSGCVCLRSRQTGGGRDLVRTRCPARFLCIAAVVAIPVRASADPHDCCGDTCVCAEEVDFTNSAIEVSVTSLVSAYEGACVAYARVEDYARTYEPTNPETIPNPWLVSTCTFPNDDYPEPKGCESDSYDVSTPANCTSAQETYCSSNTPTGHSYVQCNTGTRYLDLGGRPAGAPCSTAYDQTFCPSVSACVYYLPAASGTSEAITDCYAGPESDGYTFPNADSSLNGSTTFTPYDCSASCTYDSPHTDYNACEWTASFSIIVYHDGPVLSFDQVLDDAKSEADTVYDYFLQDEYSGGPYDVFLVECVFDNGTDHEMMYRSY